MSNNKSRILLRKSGTHNVYDRPSSILDVDRMAEMSKMIVSITGKLETVNDVSEKFLEMVYRYKTDPSNAVEVTKKSGLEKSVVIGLFEYFGAISNQRAQSLIRQIFKARRC